MSELDDFAKRIAQKKAAFDRRIRDAEDDFALRSQEAEQNFEDARSERDSEFRVGCNDAGEEFDRPKATHDDRNMELRTNEGTIVAGGAEIARHHDEFPKDRTVTIARDSSQSDQAFEFSSDLHAKRAALELGQHKALPKRRGRD